jgi:hypothetical protein
MIKAILSRCDGKLETKGNLFILYNYDLLYSCKTLELPWNGNQKNSSCIPVGNYEVVKYDSPNKGMVFLLKDVPGRDSIEIHSGNYAAGNHIDTKGCILPGAGFEDINGDGNLDVFDSRKTMDRLLAVLPDEFTLNIV